MKYYIVLNSDEDEVCKRVNALLKFGWKLHGGPVILHSREHDRDYILQAMVSTC